MVRLSTTNAKDNTRLIQAAIDAANMSGGGTVTIPPGTYPSGSVELKSGVELRLAHAACLLACDDPSLFKPIGSNDSKLTANPKIGALVQAKDASNIAISGSGILDGGGKVESTPDWKDAQSLFRPAVAYMENCSGVSIRDVRIRNSKWWTLHLRRCEDTMIRGIRIHATWPNSDGIDPDGCRNMVISDCCLDCGDDCIVLKSTQGDPCENIVVSNCVLKSTCAAFKLGTESLGRFRNISVVNCTAQATVGIGFYLKDGGEISNVLISQFAFSGESDFPLLIDATPRDYRKAESAGQISNIRLHNCSFMSSGRIWVSGTPNQPARNISLSEIDWLITGPLAETPATRPLGSARTLVDPDRPNFEANRAQILAVHVNNMSIHNVKVSGLTEGRDFSWTYPARPPADCREFT